MPIYFKEAGNRQGKIIMFIHGGGISGWMWDKQVEYFKDYYCIIPDLPEHGNSINQGQISIKSSASLIAKLIEKKANGKKVNIVGHSLGAKILIELLNTRPELIDHAIIASALCRNIPLMKLSHKLSIYKLTVAMLKINWIIDFEVKQFNFRDKISNHNLKKDFQSMTPNMLYRVYDEVYKNLIVPKELENIDVRALVVAGEREPKAMKLSVTDITNALSNSKGILIKNGLHTYPWALYDSFNEVIREWIVNDDISNENIIRL